jgi:hypothetical protein
MLVVPPVIDVAGRVVRGDVRRKPVRCRLRKHGAGSGGRAMRRRVAVTLTVLLTIGSSSPQAYLKLGAMVNGRVIDATWNQCRSVISFPIAPAGGVSAIDLRGAVERATATWSRVESANVRFTFQGMTSAAAEGFDGQTTLGFIDRPDLDRVLGATSFLIDTTSGAIVEADIFFNSRFAFSVAPTASRIVSISSRSCCTSSATFSGWVIPPSARPNATPPAAAA